MYICFSIGLVISWSLNSFREEECLEYLSPSNISKFGRLEALPPEKISGTKLSIMAYNTLLEDSRDRKSSI